MTDHRPRPERQPSGKPHHTFDLEATRRSMAVPNVTVRASPITCEAQRPSSSCRRSPERQPFGQAPSLVSAARRSRTSTVRASSINHRAWCSVRDPRVGVPNVNRSGKLHHLGVKVYWTVPNVNRSGKLYPSQGSGKLQHLAHVIADSLGVIVPNVNRSGKPHIAMLVACATRSLSSRTSTARSRVP